MPDAYDSAIDRIERRTPVASRLRTAEWAAVPAAMKDRAFFSAAVDDVNLVTSMRDKVDQALRQPPDQLTMDRSRFVAELRREMGAAPGDTGRLTDPASMRRLGLIYDMNVEEAYEYGRVRAGDSEAIRDIYPARELIRIEDRVNTRDWVNRWLSAGGTLYGGRMVALKDAAVWESISRFGRPWPPFDFNSGMGVRDIDRDEAEHLGVIAPDAPAPDALLPAYNDKLSATARFGKEEQAAIDRLKDEFGDQVFFSRGRVFWAGSRLDDLYDSALRSGSTTAGSFRFGKPSASSRDKMPPAAVETIGDRPFSVTGSNIGHALERHGPPGIMGPGTGETRRDQLPLTRGDIQSLNQVWMSPDEIRMEGTGVQYRKKVPGGILTMILSVRGETLQPVSITKKRPEAE